MRPDDHVIQCQAVFLDKDGRLQGLSQRDDVLQLLWSHFLRGDSGEMGTGTRLLLAHTVVMTDAGFCL